MLSDLERYKLLSALLDPVHKNEHGPTLIKGVKIKKLCSQGATESELN